MISKTTERDKNGWYYSFRKRNDGTIIIQQKNSSNKVHKEHNEIHIYGDGVLDTLKEVINFKTITGDKA